MLYLVTVIFCAGFVTNCAFVAAAAAGARLCGVDVKKLQVGWIPIFHLRRLHFGLIPLGSYVRFAHSSEDADTTDASALFDSKPRWVRALLPMTGVAGMFLLAFALRGVDAWHSFVHGFSQLFEGTLAPVERGADLLSDYARVARESGPIIAVSVFAAKVAAFNLLPVPILAGGQALLEIVGATGPGPAADRRLRMLTQIGLCVMVAIACAWLFALVVALRISGR